jgi:hypothetical protein
LSSQLIRHKKGSVSLSVDFDDPVPAQNVVIMVRRLTNNSSAYLGLFGGTAWYPDFEDSFEGPREFHNGNPLPYTSWSGTSSYARGNAQSSVDDSPIFVIGNSMDTVDWIQLTVSDPYPPDVDDTTYFAIGVRTPAD